MAVTLRVRVWIETIVQVVSNVHVRVTLTRRVTFLP